MTVMSGRGPRLSCQAKEHPSSHWVLEELGQESRAFSSGREKAVYPRAQEPTGFAPLQPCLGGLRQEWLEERHLHTDQESQGAEVMDVRGWPQVSRGGSLALTRSQEEA